MKFEKMTDEQIIKAFTLCKNIRYCCDENCPFFAEDCYREKTAKYALDLIERQRAEIEQLKEELADARCSNATATVGAIQDIDYLVGEMRNQS